MNVVNISVATPEYAFDPGAPSVAGIQESADGNALQVLVGSSTQSDELGPIPGLQWFATVTMTGPGPGGIAGVAEMRVGFFQLVTSYSVIGEYDNGTTLTATFQTPLPWPDKSDASPGPWYATLPQSFFNGGSIDLRDPKDFTKTIKANDTPSFSIPLYSDQRNDVGNGNGQLTRIISGMSFKLDVAAKTLDSPTGAATMEATANWSWQTDIYLEPGSPYSWEASTLSVTAPEKWITESKEWNNETRTEPRQFTGNDDDYAKAIRESQLVWKESQSAD